VRIYALLRARLRGGWAGAVARMSGEVDGVDPVELAGDDGPGGACVVLGDADEDQCEQAQRDVVIERGLIGGGSPRTKSPARNPALTEVNMRLM
jgi:hypothetical protein